MRNLKKFPESAGLEPITGLQGAQPLSMVTLGGDYARLGSVVYTNDGTPAQHETQAPGLRRAWHS